MLQLVQNPSAMSRLTFLFLSFIFCAQLYAQQVRDNGLELLFTDSLQIRLPVDTLDQGVDNHKAKFQDLKKPQRTIWSQRYSSEQ